MGKRRSSLGGTSNSNIQKLITSTVDTNIEKYGKWIYNDYEKVTRNAVSDILDNSNNFSSEEIEELLYGVSEGLYDKMFDLMPYALQNKFTWDSFFGKIVDNKGGK